MSRKGRGCNTGRLTSQRSADLPNLIEERVEAARKGRNPYVICRLPSGWLVIGDVQPLPGNGVLPADPVVASCEWRSSRPFDQAQDGAFVERMRQYLARCARSD